MRLIRFDFEYCIIHLSLFPAYGVPEPEQTVFSNCDRKTDASFFHNADNTESEFLSKASIRRMWRNRRRKVCFCRQLLPFRFAHTLFFFIGIKSAHLQPEERLMIVLINHDGQSVFLPIFPQRLKELTAEWRTWREKFLSDVYHILSLQSNPITGSRNVAMT